MEVRMSLFQRLRCLFMQWLMWFKNELRQSKVKKMKLEIYEADDGWRWRVTARNGEIVAASSEAFTRKHGAKRNLWTTINALCDLMDELS
jgi:uncharacterized protein YegP (UPF0339 family)